MTSYKKTVIVIVSRLLKYLPVMVTSTKRKYNVLKAYMYVIEADVTFLA